MEIRRIDNIDSGEYHQILVKYMSRDKNISDSVAYIEIEYKTIKDSNLLDLLNQIRSFTYMKPYGLVYLYTSESIEELRLKENELIYLLRKKIFELINLDKQVLKEYEDAYNSLNLREKKLERILKKKSIN